MRIEFTIFGKPQRWMRPGQATDSQGRSFRFTDKQAEAAKAEIARLGRIAFKGVKPATGPVLLRVRGIFAIPESWPRKTQRAAAEGRILHVADPDLDQLVKLVQDALVGIAYVDDNQVAGYPQPAKRYGAPERTEVMVEVLDQSEDEKTPGQLRLEKRIALEGWDAVLFPERRPKNTSKTSTGSRLSVAELGKLRGTVKAKPSTPFGRRGR